VVALLSDDSLTGRGDDLAARYRELRDGGDRDAARRWRQETRRLGSGGPARTAMSDDLAVGTVVGLAYPDRIARARGADTVTYRMTGGTGAQLAESSPLRRTPWLAIAVADRQPGRADARVRTAAPIDELTARAVAADLITTSDEIEWTNGALVARRMERLGAIALSTAPLRSPDPMRVQAVVREGLRAGGLDAVTWTDAARDLRARLGFLHAVLGDPWPDVDDAALLERLDEWLDISAVRRSADLRRIDVYTALRRLLPWPAATRLDELAPERLHVPSGSRVRVTYSGADAPVVAVKLQETFGWTQTPALADGGPRSPPRRPRAPTVAADQRRAAFQIEVAHPFFRLPASAGFLRGGLGRNSLDPTLHLGGGLAGSGWPVFTARQGPRCASEVLDGGRGEEGCCPAIFPGRMERRQRG
jgi:ATP-dependent helicase HrpB